ncbi:MAG: hypothetical protein AB1393_14025 [Candidatus Edwardsbacteria bacterium]
MIKTTTLILLSVIFTTGMAYSQEIQLKKSFWTGYKFIQNGKEQGIGFAGGNLKKAVVTSPEAVKEVNTYATFSVSGNIAAGVGGFLAGYALTSKMEKEKKKQYYIGAAVSITIGAILQALAEPRIPKAVEIYNASLSKRQ